MKNTYRVFAVLIVMAMLSALTGCGTPSKKEPDVRGTWRMNEAELDGEKLSGDDIDVEFIIELDASGMAEIAFDDESESGSWTQSGNSISIDAEDEYMELTYENGTLILNEDGDTFIFAKQSETTKIAEKAAMRKKIVGLWQIAPGKSGDMDDTIATLRALGMADYYFDFKDNGTVWASFFGMEGQEMWETDGKNVRLYDNYGNKILDLVLEDDMLSTNLNGTIIGFKKK